jgi:hypothetical protein
MTMRRRQALKAGVGALAGIVGAPAIMQAPGGIETVVVDGMARRQLSRRHLAEIKRA